MRITPLDIRNHDFHQRFKGYDGAEVDDFLRMIAEDYEGVLRELASLRDDKGQLEVRVAELSGREAILQETLTTAQQMSEDLKRTALKESEVMLGEAEIKAEKILDAAHRRAARLAEDIREMKSLRSRLSAAVRAAIETHLGLLEGLAEDDSEDPGVEGKVAYLTRAPGTTTRSQESS
jgi:cell division initiation protein